MALRPEPPFTGVSGSSRARNRKKESQKSGETRGPGSLGGPGSWYSHAQSAHSSRRPQAGTPSRAWTPCPLPLPKVIEVQEGGGSRQEGGRPGSKRGRGPGSWCSSGCTGQEAWEYHEPGPPNEPGPLAFSQKRFLSGKKKAHQFLAHKPFEKAVKPGTTCRLAQTNACISCVPRRTHKLF